MVASVDWPNIRVWNGSQQGAFEELCCQLASDEPPGLLGSFVRRAPPDAGIECFWLDSNGAMYAWQAKFFMRSPDEGQWRQIDESVHTAIRKNPAIIQYTICLPVDRADPQLDSAQHFMDRWNERVAKWSRWAGDAGRTINFRYWGRFELSSRLMRDENRGRLLYWFSKQWFSKEWFADNLKREIANVGDRYIPDVNVTVPLSAVFAGLGRTEAFYSRFGEFAREIRKNARYAIDHKLRELLPDA